jgi:hypothetical protein
LGVCVSALWDACIWISWICPKKQEMLQGQGKSQILLYLLKINNKSIKIFEIVLN